jgi:hypothetical protein
VSRKLFNFAGHTYEVISGALTWEQARLSASNSTFGGAGGYLAAITSAEESLAVQLGNSDCIYLEQFL